MGGPDGSLSDWTGSHQEISLKERDMDLDQRRHWFGRGRSCVSAPCLLGKTGLPDTHVPDTGSVKCTPLPRNSETTQKGLIKAPIGRQAVMTSVISLNRILIFMFIIWGLTEQRKRLSLWVPLSFPPAKPFKNSGKLSRRRKACGSRCFTFCSRSLGLETARELN